MLKRAVRGIRVTTRYATVDEFVERYCEQADLDSIYVTARIDPQLLEIDNECGFAFLLSNASPVLAGTCFVSDLELVVDLDDEAEIPVNPQGIRLQIRTMGPDSWRVFEELLCARRKRLRKCAERYSQTSSSSCTNAR